MDNPNIFDIVEDHPEWLPDGSDMNKKKSAAFVLLCISTCLEMPLEEAIVQKFEDSQAEYHANAVKDVIDALKACYGKREISLQQLSATFRRGDLLEMLGSL
jgi:hypothetical protein